MMPVPQHVLNWLYNILTSEYHDVGRTYNDVARSLHRFATLSPRTDVHTFSNGSSALLLHLSGTIPVVFRGTAYRFPVSIWIPHAYPREPPLVYVTPTESMLVRPGQHVDPQGQVYHPYLMKWPEFWDKSTLEDFLLVLSDIFAKEPPVISREASTSTIGPPHPPPIPHPPLLSPPLVEATVRPDSEPRTGPITQDPPLLPPKTPQSVSAVPAGQALQKHSNPGSAQSPIRLRYESAPPLPCQTQNSGPSSKTQLQHPSFGHSALDSRQCLNGRDPPSQPTLPSAFGLPSFDSVNFQHAAPQLSHRQQVHRLPPLQNELRTSAISQLPWEQPAPPIDLLDEPLGSEISAQTVVAAPPIPPNPEDALLRQLAQALASIRQRSLQNNAASMAGLAAQRMAMQAAVPALQQEAGQLTRLSRTLTTNTKILREALQKADSVIEDSKNHPAPDVDELLVAPTVVSNQLYQLVAEERTLGDAIFMLGRAVERGRVSPAAFAKTTRFLAREWYLKKALVRKIGEGMAMAM